MILISRRPTLCPVFLSGLSEDLRHMVKMIRPRTVEHAVECARLQEMVVEALMKKQRQQSKAMAAGTSHQGGKGINQEWAVSNSGAKPSGVPHTMGRFNEQRR